MAESVKGFQEETTSHAKYWPREHSPFGELVQVKPFREQVLEKKMATQSNILAWRVLWIEEPGGLQFMGSQRVRHD